jgi:excisionase family DNA binding protein
MMAPVPVNPDHGGYRCDNARQGMPGPTLADAPSSTRAADRIAATFDRTTYEKPPPVMDDDTYWDPFPNTLSPTDVATILRVGRPAVRAKLKNGIIPGHLIAGSWVVFKAELRAAIEATSNQAAPSQPQPVDVLADYNDEMTYHDLMNLLGKSKRTIYTWLNSGEIPAFHIGTRWIIHKGQLRQKLLDTSNQTPREET